MKVRDIEAHFTINGQEVSIESIPDKSLTWEQLKTVRANYKGFLQIYPKLDNNALIQHVLKNILPNCTQHSSHTYDKKLQSVFVPLLCKRIEELETELEKSLTEYEELTKGLSESALNRKTWI